MKKLLCLISLALLLSACGSGGNGGSSTTPAPVMAKLVLGNFSAASGEYRVTTTMRFAEFVNVSSSRLVLGSNSTGQAYTFTNKSYTVTQDTEETLWPVPGQLMAAPIHAWTVTSNNVISPAPPAGSYVAMLTMHSHGEFFRGDNLPYQVQ